MYKYLITLRILIVFLVIGLVKCYSQTEKKQEAWKSKPGYFTNPVIPGFNPDPCIIRVENDFYIATSTFEWFPGIPVYHSRDLINWHIVGHVLTSKNLADLKGIGNSNGIFAPHLNYHGGYFYVAFTVVSGDFFPFFSTPNYVTRSKNINGPWSEPVYLNSTGFDPALFFDDDGKVYCMNMLLDHFQSNISGGINLQEFDPVSMKLTGNARTIFKSTGFCTEGPHIYKKGGYYYLFVAEGGTGFNHQETVARSENIWGPYELNPGNPLITSKGDLSLTLQRAGHASLVETQNHEWYIAFLASRPLMPEKRSVLGRETCLQKIEWNDSGWPVLADGGHSPSILVQKPVLSEFVFPQLPARDDFEGNELRKEYITLRAPIDESWASLKIKQGYLALKGRRSFSDKDGQSLIARRITSLNAEIETCVSFEPGSYRHMAGLTCFYDTKDFIYFKITYRDPIGKCLNITHQTALKNIEPYLPVEINGWEKIFMKATIYNDSIQFAYSSDGKLWKKYGYSFYSGQLADENNRNGFTGAVAGICAQDMEYERKYAFFDYFKYQDIDP